MVSLLTFYFAGVYPCNHVERSTIAQAKYSVLSFGYRVQVFEQCKNFKIYSRNLDVFSIAIEFLDTQRLELCNLEMLVVYTYVCTFEEKNVNIVMNVLYTGCKLVSCGTVQCTPN